jgi:twitching motility protein PilU
MKAIISQRLVRTPDGSGRRAAVEILLNTPLIADSILKGQFNTIKETMAKSRELGMQTFDQALFDLYNEGAISHEEALRNADSVNELRLQIKLKSTRSDATSGSSFGELNILRDEDEQENI